MTIHLPSYLLGAAVAVALVLWVLAAPQQAPDDWPTDPYPNA
jgi:hypothetical protein